MSASKSKFLRTLICFIAFLSCLTLIVPLSGQSAQDAERTIKLICRNDDTIIQGMEWRLYRIGERTDDGLSLTGDFSKYPVNINDLTENNVAQKAKTLESYAVADSLQPIASGKTESNGELAFNSLDNGLFLAAGTTLQVGDTYFVPSSLIVETNDTDSIFLYNAYPKFFYATLSDSLSAHTVKKVWDDENAVSSRPDSVTVELFSNGKLQKTVVLSSANNWEYSWKDSDSINDWHVVERNVPDDYNVLIDFNRSQYLIKNSYISTQVTTTTTAPITTSTYSSTSAQSTTSLTSSLTSASTSTTLPPLIQTGQLWWPVLLLGAGGILLLSLGAAMKKKKEDE